MDWIQIVSFGIPTAIAAIALLRQVAADRNNASSQLVKDAITLYKEIDVKVNKLEAEVCTLQKKVKRQEIIISKLVKGIELLIHQIQVEFKGVPVWQPTADVVELEDYSQSQ